MIELLFEIQESRFGRFWDPERAPVDQCCAAPKRSSDIVTVLGRFHRHDVQIVRQDHAD
jgi:hypothetical protein